MASWISNLDCGSGTQTGADIISQINKLSKLFENAIFMTNDISGFDNINGTGLVGTEFEGFQLCNGNNGTPDLRSSFIVSYDTRDSDYDTIGNIGGEKRVTLTEAQMPEHDHDFTFPYNFPKSGGADAAITVGGASYGLADFPTMDTPKKGSSQAHENRPPYYVLAFYKKY